MNREQVVHTDPEIMSGTPVFVGTRVPVQTFVEYLEGGYDLDEFLDHFPSVRREQAIAFIDQAQAGAYSTSRHSRNQQPSKWPSVRESAVSDDALAPHRRDGADDDQRQSARAHHRRPGRQVELT